MRSAVMILLLVVVAGATATSTKAVANKEKDIITDILSLFEWAVGLLEMFGFNIMDILSQFLPAELLEILQMLQDIGIFPIAKRSIIDDLWAAIDLIMQMGMDAFAQLAELLPPEILQILEMLFELGVFPKNKDLITDILGLFDWALGLLELFGFNIMDILSQFLPAELLEILQMLIDIGIIPIAKRSIIDDLWTAINAMIEMGLEALQQFVDFIPAEILQILQMLFELGIFPKTSLVARQSFDEWLMALMDILFQILGDTALEFLIQIAADFGIPAELIQILWDLVIDIGIPKDNHTHAIRVDIIDWAIQMLLEFGLEALTTLAEFIPAEILSMLVDLILGGAFPKH